MSDYRIEKLRRPVTLSLAGGGTVEGDVFVQPSVRYRAGAESPLDLMNEAEAFLPLAVGGEDGRMVLVAKDHVTTVKYVPDLTDTQVEAVPGGREGAGAGGVGIDLVLADGSRVSGEIHPEVRAERPRLLDYLNSVDDRFVGVQVGHECWLVNRRYIVQVVQRT